jgi:hypothetical protein
MEVMVLCSGAGPYMKYAGEKRVSTIIFGVHRRRKDAGENCYEAIGRVRIKPKIQNERQ